MEREKKPFTFADIIGKALKSGNKTFLVMASAAEPTGMTKAIEMKGNSWYGLLEGKDPASIDSWEPVTMPGQFVEIPQRRCIECHSVIDVKEYATHKAIAFLDAVYDFIHAGMIVCPACKSRIQATGKPLLADVTFGELPQCPGCEKRGFGKDHHTCSASSCIRPRAEPGAGSGGN